MSVDQLAAIGEVHRLFEQHRVPYWLFGGWAVEFHAGRVTRSHGDIDLAVWLSDLGRARELLEQERWRLITDRPTDGSVTFERSGLVMDVALLDRDEDGVIYTPSTSGRGNWPDASFGSDVAILDDVVARVVSRTSLIADKSVPRGGPDSAAKDHADVALLTSLE